MRAFSAVVLFGAVFLSAASAEPDALDYAKPGKFAVDIVKFDWTDAGRGRQVPVKICYPAGARGPSPVIIFSHGLGGSRDGYEYLGRHWASWGFVSVHVQHIGSDTAVWKEGPNVMANLNKAAMDPSNIINRPLDISFVIDRLAELNKSDAIFKGRLDMGRIGVGGHSFGAYTALAVAGQKFLGRQRFRDGRVKAAVIMSAPVLKTAEPRNFSDINIPCLHMTGTRDISPIGDTNPADRRVPFDAAALADCYLLTLEGGDHMVFSGVKRPGDAEMQRYVLASSTLFWEAFLRGDKSAAKLLAGFAKTLGPAGTFEQKPAAKH